MTDVKDSIVSYYDSVSEVYGVKHGVDLYGNKWADEKYYGPLVERFIPKDSNILEIGCGTGHFTGMLRRRSGRVCGIDLSPGMVEVAKKRNPDVTFFVGDCEELKPFKDQDFDAVAAFNTFSYYPDKRRALGAISRVLKKDGIFFDLDMNPLNPIYITTSWMNRNEMKDWYRYIKESSRRNLARLFDEAGFDVIHQDALCWIPNALNKPAVTLLIPFDALLSRIPLVRNFAMRVVVAGRKR